MNTKLLMVSSAIFMGIAGIAVSFFPQEILNHLNIDSNSPQVILMQITGALYLGFGLLNWTARGNLIGGIYSRPVSVGNLLHFTMVAIALIKLILSQKPHLTIFYLVTVLYVLFALAFWKVFVTHPIKE